MKLEAVTLPVSHVDRAKRFYATIGWRLDADIIRAEHFPMRAVHAAPPDLAGVDAPASTSADPHGSTSGGPSSGLLSACLKL